MDQLISSSRMGDLKDLKSLVSILKSDTDIDINARDNTGWSALTYACALGHLEVARLLIQHGADINSTDNFFGQTNLLWACRRGHLDIIFFLVQQGADINIPDNYGETALIHACTTGNLEVDRLLLQHGADINTSDIKGWTSEGWNSLMYACSTGHLDIVHLLLQHGADVNAQDDSGWTPLMLASSEGHLDIVKCLIENGSDTITIDGNSNVIESAVTAYQYDQLHVVYYLMFLKDDVIQHLPNDDEYLNKYIRSVNNLKKFRNRVKRYSAMCGLSPKRLSNFVKLIKNKEFGSWWYSPEAPGGKRHLENMRRWFSTTHGV